MNKANEWNYIDGSGQSVRQRNILFTLANEGVNKVFLSGVYPQGWCKAKLTTVFKKGDKSQPKNYRSISELTLKTVK